MDIRGFLVPVLELVGVLCAAILIVSLLVTGLVHLLKAFVARAAIPSYRSLWALRILVGYREPDSGFLGRLVPVSSQNFIAMVGTALGVWALIVVLSVMGGFEADLKGKIVRHSPHITLLLDPLAGFDRDAASLALSLSNIEHVVASEAYVEADVMLTSPTNMSPGMTLFGVRAGSDLERAWLDPVTDPTTLLAFQDPVLVVSDRELGFRTRGTAAEPSDAAVEPGEAPDSVMPAIPAAGRPARKVRPGVVLGEELAHSLMVSAGDTVTVVIPDGDVGPMGVRPRTRVVRVAGTFQSGLYEYDLKTAFMTLEAARDLLQLGDANRIGILLDDVDHLNDAVAAIRAVAPPGAEVRTVAQTHRALFSALALEKVAMFLVLGLVILVASFNIFGSLILITFEKTRDIAVIESLGATRRGVASVFVMLGAVIGAVGTAAGLFLGLGTCAYIGWTGIRLPSEYYLRTLPVEVQAGEVVLVLMAALAAAVVATIHPAKTAARLSPADGLRND